MIPKHYLLETEEREFLNERGWKNMNQKELIVTFRWDSDVSNLLPTEINRVIGGCAGQLNKTAGKSIATATYDFGGKTHNVPLKDFVSAA